MGNYDKIILWTPTFRQPDYLGYNDSGEEDILPLFKEEDYGELNDFLTKLNYRLIVKIHPSQDLSRYHKLKFSHLEILSDWDFAQKKMELYNLLPQVDFLVADYSSVHLQFLLLNKPICFAVPDYEDYAAKRGFVFENPEEFMPGPKIKSKEDFYRCITEFGKDNDQWKRERERVKQLIHKYADGKSCERLIKISGITK